MTESNRKVNVKWIRIAEKKKKKGRNKDIEDNEEEKKGTEDNEKKRKVMKTLKKNKRKVKVDKAQ